MDIIQELNKEQLEKLSAGKTIPEFGPGDTIIVQPSTGTLNGGIALQAGQQGTILLMLGGDAAGNIVSVDVKETSGFPILDHATVDFIKRRWHLPAGADNQLFQTRITYKLQLN